MPEMDASLMTACALTHSTRTLVDPAPRRECRTTSTRRVLDDHTIARSRISTDSFAAVRGRPRRRDGARARGRNGRTQRRHFAVAAAAGDPIGPRSSIDAQPVIGNARTTHADAASDDGGNLVVAAGHGTMRSVRWEPVRIELSANAGDEQYFASAQGSDDGDPHLSFNGAKWNSMQSHPNLLQSNSIPGGYRVSTQVTNANARGITRNQSAQITLDGGRTTIGLNGDGKASIVRNGENVPIAPGQTVQLGSGTTVTCKPNGALSVNSRNAMGGQISTTLSTKNGGVNVNVSAQNVDLGGALVRGQSVSPPPSPLPSPTPGGPPGQFVQPPIMQVPPYETQPPAYQEQPAMYQEQPTQYDNL